MTMYVVSEIVKCSMLSVTVEINSVRILWDVRFSLAPMVSNKVLSWV